MDQVRELTGHGVLTLYVSTDQTDIGLFVKVSLLSSAPTPGCPSSHPGLAARVAPR
jgi:hypothetical protein